MHEDGSARRSAVSDEALAAAAAEGDERSFEQLYARYLPVARRSARRAARTHPQIDVEEAANLALTRLWEVMGHFDTERAFAPWAAVVISHAVRSAAAASRTVRSQLNWGALLAAAPTPEEDLLGGVADRVAPDREGLAGALHSEEEQLVADILAELLSPREAKVVRLRLAGWTYSEIADRLGMEPKAVDNAIARGMHKLRRAFADHPLVRGRPQGVQR